MSKGDKGVILMCYFECRAAAAYCKEILGLLNVKDCFLLSNVDVQVEILGDLVAKMGFLGWELLLAPIPPSPPIVCQ